MTEVQIPIEFFQEDISLASVGLICMIYVKDKEIRKFAQEKKMPFDAAVMALFMGAYGKHTCIDAMNGLIKAGLYEVNEEELKTEEGENKKTAKKGD